MFFAPCHFDQLVEDAQCSKAPIQALADNVASVFVPAAIAVAAITFMGWYAAGKGWLQIPGFNGAAYTEAREAPFVFALIFALSVLVVACPCALGLATPTAVMVGSGIAAKRGVLVKGGEALEALHKVSAVVLDKTGTLTEDHLVVSHFVRCPAGNRTAPGAPVSAVTDVEVDDGVLLSMIAVAEASSEHPIGSALFKYAKDFVALESPQPEVINFEAIAGFGIKAKLQRQDTTVNIIIGNREFLHCHQTLGLSLVGAPHDGELVVEGEIEEDIRRFESEGRVVILVAIDGALTAYACLESSSRPEARSVIATLKVRRVLTFFSELRPFCYSNCLKLVARREGSLSLCLLGTRIVRQQLLRRTSASNVSCPKRSLKQSLKPSSPCRLVRVFVFVSILYSVNKSCNGSSAGPC